ncbi:MAG: response regulator [Bacteroidales bacterium]|nr:response regulator [Bacteroidales bacterium]
MPKMSTILYVDDEKINLMLFEVNFRNKFNIISAFSGKDGLNKLSQNTNIDVVISDMKMPQMNGVEFITKVKENRPNLPCFILTGYDLTPEISEAINLKIVDRYLAKPFNINEIESAIISVLK